MDMRRFEKFGKNTSGSENAKSYDPFKQNEMRKNLLGHNGMDDDNKKYINRSYEDKSFSGNANKINDKNRKKLKNKDGLSGQKEKNKEKPINHRKSSILNKVGRHIGFGAFEGASWGTVVYPGPGTAVGAAVGGMAGFAEVIATTCIDEANKEKMAHRLGTGEIMIGEYTKIQKSEKNRWSKVMWSKVKEFTRDAVGKKDRVQQRQTPVFQPYSAFDTL